MSQSIRPSLNSVTIGAADGTFSYFLLGLAEALRIAYIKALITLNVIEVQRRGMFVEPAIDASCTHFVGIEPSANQRRSFICYGVIPLSIFWVGKALEPPLLHLHWIVDPVTRASIGSDYLIGITKSPTPRCVTLMLLSFLCGEHNWSLS
jgi:hypothetical protein